MNWWTGLAVAVFIFLVAGWIAVHAVRQIMTPHLAPAWWTLLLLAGVVGTKMWFSKRKGAVGEEMGSTALGIEAEGMAGLLQREQDLLDNRSATLRDLAQHDVVPVVVWDPAEFTLSAPRGLACGIDPESGERRLIWWRPALREKWAAALAARRHDLQTLFRAMRVKPIFIEQGFDADAVTRHFHS